jgi:hypothetical protein
MSDAGGPRTISGSDGLFNASGNVFESCRLEGDAMKLKEV